MGIFVSRNGNTAVIAAVVNQNQKARAMRATTRISQFDLSDWLEPFSAWLAQQGKSTKTVEAYCLDLLRFADWIDEMHQERLEPHMLTHMELHTYREYCLRAEPSVRGYGVAPATWNRRRAALSAFCDWGLEQGWLASDPMVQVHRVEPDPNRARWLTNREYTAVVRQVEQQVNLAAAPLTGRSSKAKTRRWRPNTATQAYLAARDQAMVALMVYAGLRVAELAQLTLGDVELGERSGRVAVRLGKGEKNRSVPLSALARSLVAPWLELRAGAALGDRLFVDPKGAPVSVRGLQKRVERIAERSGTQFTAHRLRHTFAKRMSDAGTPINQVQRLMGHGDIRTTTVYLEPGWEDLEAAVEDVPLGGTIQSERKERVYGGRSEETRQQRRGDPDPGDRRAADRRASGRADRRPAGAGRANGGGAVVAATRTGTRRGQGAVVSDRGEAKVKKGKGKRC